MTKTWPIEIELHVELNGSDLESHCHIDGHIPHWLTIAIDDACNAHAPEIFDGLEEAIEQEAAADDRTSHELMEG